MSLTNISQLLLRNDEFFSAKEPLFINLLPDDFSQSYLLKNPTANITSYNTHFEYYQKHKTNNGLNGLNFCTILNEFLLIYCYFFNIKK